MKWKNKQVYYTIKDNFEVSERHMAYWYAIGGFVSASVIWWIV